MCGFVSTLASLSVCLSADRPRHTRVNKLMSVSFPCLSTFMSGIHTLLPMQYHRVPSSSVLSHICHPLLQYEKPAFVHGDVLCDQFSAQAISRNCCCPCPVWTLSSPVPALTPRSGSPHASTLGLGAAAGHVTPHLMALGLDCSRRAGGEGERRGTECTGH